MSAPHRAQVFVWFALAVLLGGVYFLAADFVLRSVSGVSTALLWTPAALLAARFGLRAARSLLALFARSPSTQENPAPPAPDVVIAVPVIVRSLADLAEIERSAFDMAGSAEGSSHPVVYLVDLPDSPTATAETDHDLLRRLGEAFARLKNTSPHVRHLVRRRAFNAVDGVWMGWERKRGKLLEFMKAAQGDQTTAFGPIEGYGHFRFLMVADADTRVLDGCIGHLRTAAQILSDRPNSPAILSPSIATLPGAAPTVFQRLWTPCVFTEAKAYRSASDDQLIFGRDLFFGKGLIDIGLFLQRMPDDLPDNRLLSHDHFEAMVAGAAHVGPATVAEVCPPDARTWAGRQQRWVRGDLQVLPVLSGRVDLWGYLKAAETTLGHLAPLAIIALAIAMAVSPGDAGALLTALVLLASPGLTLLPVELAGHARALRARSPVDLVKALVNQAFGTAALAMVEFVYLLRLAGVVSSAAVETAWRFTVLRRDFMKWSAHAAGVRRARGAGSLLSLVCVLALAAAAPTSAVFTLILGALWIGAPLMIDRPGRPLLWSPVQKAARPPRARAAALEAAE